MSSHSVENIDKPCSQADVALGTNDQPCNDPVLYGGSDILKLSERIEIAMERTVSRDTRKTMGTCVPDCEVRSV